MSGGSRRQDPEPRELFRSAVHFVNHDMKRTHSSCGAFALVANAPCRGRPDSRYFVSFRWGCVAQFPDGDVAVYLRPFAHQRWMGASLRLISSAENASGSYSPPTQPN